MDEYISREATIDKMRSLKSSFRAKNDWDSGYDTAIAEAFEHIKRVKSADVQPVKQWISVKDRLPEIGKSVLIYYPKWDGDEIQVAKLEDDGMMFDICGEFNIGTGVITHWMPLPEPPKDGDTNG